MKVFRITGSKHANDLSGTGAAIYGGRWNKKGTPVLYTGESKEIALLEIIVHTPPMLIPDLDILEIDIPDGSITNILMEDLPANWYNYPAPTVLSEIGENWIMSGETLALRVPSCIIHTANIIIINCQFPNYTNLIKIIDHRNFYFDSRLTS